MGALYGVYDMDGMFILYDIRLTRAVARINKCIFSYLYCCVFILLCWCNRILESNRGQKTDDTKLSTAYLT